MQLDYELLRWLMKKKGMLKLADLEKIRDKIKNAPPPRPEEREFTLREAVSYLAKEIKSLREKGYSFEAISRLLSNNGLKTSPLTLQKYISAISKNFSMQKRHNDSNQSQSLKEKNI